MELIRNMKNLDETKNYKDVILFINKKSKETLLNFRLFIKSESPPAIFYIYFEENTIKYVGKLIDNLNGSFCDYFISFDEFEWFLKKHMNYNKLWSKSMCFISKIFYEK